MRNTKRIMWLIVVTAIVCALTLAVALPASANENANVAKIGDTEYATLDAAIAAAADGDTVTLIHDANVTAVVTLSGKSITLDLNGMTLTSSADGISVEAGAALTVTGNGKIVATGKYSNAIANSGTLTIENGTFTAGYGTVRALGGSTTTINGGTFESSGGRYGMYYWANSNKTALTVTINNGIFKNSVSTAMESGLVTLKVRGGSFANDLSAYCEDGFGTTLDGSTKMYEYGKVSSPDSYVEDANGNVTISGENGLIWFAKQVNEKGNTFKGKTVTLAADITLTDTWTPVGVSVNEPFRGTFDGAGHTISGMKMSSLAAREYGYGFFKLIISATVKNVIFDNATVDMRNSNIVGIVAGYSYGSSTFENVHVTSSTVYAYGKVGGMVGMADEDRATTTFTGCSVEDSTIHVGYNGAGFLGLAMGKCKFAGSYLKNNEVIVDENSEGFGALTELDTTVTCDGSVATCAGNGTVIKGRYIPNGNYYYSAYSDLYNHYGDSKHDCTLANGKYLANSEVTHDALVTIVRGKAEYLFADLQCALDFANDGETVKLLADIYVTEGLNIKDKKITLDLNGKTIANTADIWDIQPALLCIENSAVTITGNGKILAKENDCYTINLVSGLLTIENGEYVGNVSAVQVEKGTLTINGGTFSLLQKWEGKSTYLINCIDDAFVNGEVAVAIKGGKFVDFDPNNSPEKKVNGVAPSFAAPGVGITKDTDGNFVAVEGMVAQVYDENHESVAAYDNLKGAINATKSGYTVTLLSNVNLGTGWIGFYKSGCENLTFDLNGHTITSESSNYGTVVASRAGLVIRNGRIVNTATSTKEKTSAVYITSGGTTTLENVTLISTHNGLYVCQLLNAVTVEVNVNDGTVINGAKYGIYLDEPVGTSAKVPSVKLNINGGTITGSKNGVYAKSAGSGKHGEVNVAITGGAVDGVQVITNNTQYPANLDITGGKINGNITSTGSNDIAISGGVFNIEVKKEWCVEGFAPKALADGTYGVEQLVKLEATEGVLGESVKFYILTNRYVGLKFRVRITLNGEEVIYNGVDYEKNGTEYYAYILDLPPQYLDADLKIELINNSDEAIQTINYSFLKYCEEVLNKDANAKQLVADLLWYSVAAKNKCKLESTTLTAKLGELGLVQSTGEIKATVTKSHTKTGEESYISGTTLYHDSMNRIIILVDSGLYENTKGNHTYTYKKGNGAAQELVKIGELVTDGPTYAMLATEGIYANEFDTAYTIEVTFNGEVVETLVYSVNNYCETKATENELAKALYYYGVSAAAYKHS